jgi:hypothetical protein
VDHDVSLLVPEIWCRMRVAERDPEYLIHNGFLEKVEDQEMDGRRVLASRLGYRITSLFVDRFLGRIFETPSAVFTQEMLRPELQDMGLFAAGVDAIVESQRRVASLYFEDGSVEAACPPLKALLHIMVCGSYEGNTIDDPRIRGMFTRESLLASDWYGERLRVKQSRDIALWKRHVKSLEGFRLANEEGAYPDALNDSLNDTLNIHERFSAAQMQLARVSAGAYLEELIGTIGADPFHLQMQTAQMP